MKVPLRRPGWPKASPDIGPVSNVAPCRTTLRSPGLPKLPGSADFHHGALDAEVGSRKWEETILSTYGYHLPYLRPPRMSRRSKAPPR